MELLFLGCQGVTWFKGFVEIVLEVYGAVNHG